jgi:SH3 domain-containing YSC84-like protein 1
MRLIPFAAAALFAVASLPALVRAQEVQQEVVDRATLAVQDMVNNRNGTQAQGVLRRARAVVVCPQVFQAGFLIAGSGGDCVLVARDGAGGWSYPAFYGIASGSFGFQAGIRDAEVMLMVMNDHALAAVMDSQFKLGADASLTFVNIGGGIEGATTAALNADIVGFTRARGLFAGISLGGSLLDARTGWNAAYYGHAFASRQVVIDMQARNPAADPLREVLTRYGTRQASALAAPPPPYVPPPQPPGYGAPVQQAPLSPPGTRR